jgi:hypothetical protein
MDRRQAAVIAAALLWINPQAKACWYHWLHGLPEPTGSWPTNLSTAQSQIASDDQANDAAIGRAIDTAAAASDSAAGSSSPALMSVTNSTSVSPASSGIDAYVTGWIINTTGATGTSTNATIKADIGTLSADVQEVAYTSTNVYIKATGIPDYSIGPWGNDPNIASNDNATFDIPRNPSEATTHTATGLGAIGVLVNGVDVFNMSDSNSYNNAGVWYNNAGYVEASSFDTSGGHPQQQGVYHYHESPTSLISELGGSSTSPVVIGYADDGFPILNDYAALTPNGSDVQMMSGYELKTYTNNVRGSGGPNVSTQYPNGYFEQDYQYVANQSLPSNEHELDQYNGAFVYTPQFPNGTYAYFATLTSSGSPAYPYMLGPDYYGTPSSDDLAGSVTVPQDATVYVTPEPNGGCMALAAALALAMTRRRRAQKRFH